jgi:hypothetical protein
MKTKIEEQILKADNLCGGELQEQLAAALEKIAKNIEKYGDAADHQVNIKLTFDKNIEFGHWEHDCRTAVQCTTKVAAIGSKHPFKIVEGSLVDANPQQDLPL